MNIMPFVDRFLGESRNVARDITAGITNRINAPMQRESTKSSFMTASQLMANADANRDPKQKQKLIRRAQDIYSRVGSQQHTIASSFSPTATDNPLVRGLKTGTEVGLTAQAILGLGGLAKNAFSSGGSKYGGLSMDKIAELRRGGPAVTSGAKTTAADYKLFTARRTLEKEMLSYPSQQSFLQSIIAKGGGVAGKADIARKAGFKNLIDMYTYIASKGVL